MILITDYAVVKCWSSSACKALWVRHQVSLKNLSFLVTSCFTDQPQGVSKSSQPSPSHENHEISAECSSPGGLGGRRKAHLTDLNAKFEIFIIIWFWGQNRALKRNLCTHCCNKNLTFECFPIQQNGNRVLCSALNPPISCVRPISSRDQIFSNLVPLYSIRRWIFCTLNARQEINNISYLLASPVSFTFQLKKQGTQIH